VVRPLWVLAGAVLLGIAGGAAIVLSTSGGEEEAALQTQESATPDASAGAAPGESKASLPGGYEFSYPVSWNQVLVSENPYIAKFVLTATPNVATEYPTEFDVIVYENSQQVALEEFFDGRERPNLFEDAVDDYKPFSVGGASGYWFDKVLGFTNSTVVALSSGGFVYQFDDPDQKHQSDGVFLEIVRSFKRVEG